MYTELSGSLFNWSFTWSLSTFFGLFTWFFPTICLGIFLRYWTPKYHSSLNSLFWEQFIMNEIFICKTRKGQIKTFPLTWKTAGGWQSQCFKKKEKQVRGWKRRKNNFLQNSIYTELFAKYKTTQVDNSDWSEEQSEEKMQERKKIGPHSLFSSVIS